MQTRIQLTIKDEDKYQLFDKQLELTEKLEAIDWSFPVNVQIFPNEPEAESLDESHFTRVYNDIETSIE